MAARIHHTKTGQRRLMATIVQRFNSGEYSDLTITCGNQGWKVHRNIVCFNSNFFATACNGNFSEAQQKQIDLPEDDPKIVDLVLQYLYKLDYNDDETSDATNKNNGTLDLNGFPSEETFPLAPSSIAAATEEQESIEDQVTRLDEPKIGKDQTLDLQKIHSCLLVNTAVYAMADRFNIPELKDLAAAKFEDSAKHWPQHYFATIVSAVLDSTPVNDGGLRPIVAEKCETQISELLGLKTRESKSNVDSKEWGKVLTKDADFLYSILRQKTAKTLELEERATAEIAQLVAEVEEQKEAKELAEDEKHEADQGHELYKSQLNNMFETAKRDHCRHCRAVFQPRFEPVINPSAGEFPFILRCAGCRTRH